MSRHNFRVSAQANTEDLSHAAFTARLETSVVFLLRFACFRGFI